MKLNLLSILAVGLTAPALGFVPTSPAAWRLPVSRATVPGTQAPPATQTPPPAAMAAPMAATPPPPAPEPAQPEGFRPGKGTPYSANRYMAVAANGEATPWRFANTGINKAPSRNLADTATNMPGKPGYSDNYMAAVAPNGEKSPMTYAANRR